MARANPAGVLSYSGPNPDLSGFIKGRMEKSALREAQLREEEVMQQRADRQEMKGILSQMDPNNPNYESAAAMLLKSGNVDAANQLLNMDLKNKEYDLAEKDYGLRERGASLDEKRFGLQAAESNERIKSSRFDRAYKEQQKRNQLAFEQLNSEVGLTDRALKNLEGIEDPEQAKQVLDKFIATIEPLNEERKKLGLNPISVPQELKSGDLQQRVGYLKDLSELGNQKLEMLNSIRGEGEGFTLKPGEARFTGSGKKIAEVPGEAKQTPYTDLAKATVDYKNGNLTEEQYKAVSKDIVASAGKDNFQTEDNLRDDYNTLSRDYFEVGRAYNRVMEAGKNPSPAGDMSLIFGIMKMNDPGSTVREGEYATAQNSASVPERLRAQYNAIVSGEKLSTAQRQDFLKTAEKLFSAAEKSQEPIRTRYEALAESYGLNPENVVSKKQSNLSGRPNSPGNLGVQGQGDNPAITQSYDQIKPKFLGFEEEQ